MEYVDPKVAVSFIDKNTNQPTTTEFVTGTHQFLVSHAAVASIKVECDNAGDGQAKVKIILQP